MEVFWGTCASRSYVRTIPAECSVMMSASGLWKGGGRWMKKRVWPWKRWMLDSGGYNAFMRWADYPWTPDEYLELVRRDAPTFAASMDYCCEPSVTERLGMSIEDRIRATADMAHYLCPRDGRVFPVIQGWTADDYELSWRLTEPLKPRMLGLGSLCVRQGEKRIAELCQELSYILPREVWKHGFGIKILALRYDPVREFFQSIDTAAWEFRRRARGWKGQRGKPGTDREAWLNYSRKLESLRCLPVQATLAFSSQFAGQEDKP